MVGVLVALRRTPPQPRGKVILRLAQVLADLPQTISKTVRLLQLHALLQKSLLELRLIDFFLVAHNQASFRVMQTN